MSLSLAFLDEAAREEEVVFAAGESTSDAADTELANDAREVQEAVNEADQAGAAIEEGVEVVEAAESLITFGQMTAAGEAVTRSGLYMAESRFEAIAAKAGHAFKSVDPIKDAPSFESAASSESSIRARAAVYAQEGFIQDATAFVKRIVAMIAGWFEKLVVVIKALFTSAAKVKKQLEDLKSSLGKSEDYLESTDKEVSVAAKWLNDGTKIDPSKAVASAKSGYTSAASKVLNITGRLKGKFAEIAANTADYEGALKYVERERSASYTKFSGPIAGRPVGQSNGSIVIGNAPSISKSSMQAMGRKALVSFIGEAIGLAEVLEKHKDHTKDAEKAKSEEVKLINEAAAKIDKASTEESDSAKTAELRRRLITLTKVSVSKDLSSLNRVCNVSFGVLLAAKSLAQANAKTLAKKKSS